MEKITELTAYLPVKLGDECPDNDTKHYHTIYLNGDAGTDYGFRINSVKHSSLYTHWLKEQKGFFLTKEQMIELLGSAFDAGRNYQRGEMSEYYGGEEHDYPNQTEFIKTLIN